MLNIRIRFKIFVTRRLNMSYYSNSLIKPAKRSLITSLLLRITRDALIIMLIWLK